MFCVFLSSFSNAVVHGCLRFSPLLRSVHFSGDRQIFTYAVRKRMLKIRNEGDLGCTTDNSFLHGIYNKKKKHKIPVMEWIERREVGEGRKKRRKNNQTKRNQTKSRKKVCRSRKKQPITSKKSGRLFCIYFMVKWVFMVFGVHLMFSIRAHSK